MFSAKLKNHPQFRLTLHQVQAITILYKNLHLNMQHLSIVHLSKLQSLMLIPPIKQDLVVTILPVKNNYIMTNLCA